MENRLAIIIPYYKKTFFEATLQSLSNQTNQRFSVYIGDDASPNASEDILKKFEGKLNFTYHRFSENKGATQLTKQWDRCIELSKNENWLMILGDDDTLEENLIEKFYENLPQIGIEKSEVVRFASQLIDEQGNTSSDVFKNPKTESASESYLRIFKGNGRSTLTEHIFSRKTYEKYGFKHFPVAFGSDVVAWFEFPDGKNIFSINDAKAFIRISGEHLSSRDEGDLKYRRREGIYLFNRYLISNYSERFGSEERFLILKKAYRNLTSSTSNKLKSLDFLLFMMKYISPLKAMQIVKENRHR